MQRVLTTFLAVMICTGMITCGSCASEAAQSSPTAQEIARQMMTFYGNLKQFNVVVSKVTTYSEGEKSKSTSDCYTLSIEKPNRLAIEVTEGQLSPTIRSDGATVVFYHPLIPKRYVSWSRDQPLVFAPLPLSMGQWHFWPTLLWTNGNVCDPLAILLKTTPNSIRLVGEEKVATNDTYHLVLPWGFNEINPQNEIHIWIQKGKEPWIVKVTMRQGFGGAAQKRFADYTEYFTDWTIEQMPKTKFAATPPAEGIATEPMVFLRIWREERRSYFLKLFDSLK